MTLRGPGCEFDAELETERGWGVRFQAGTAYLEWYHKLCGGVAAPLQHRPVTPYTHEADREALFGGEHVCPVCGARLSRADASVIFVRCQARGAARERERAGTEVTDG